MALFPNPILQRLVAAGRHHGHLPLGPVESQPPQFQHHHQQERLMHLVSALHGSYDGEFQPHGFGPSPAADVARLRAELGGVLPGVLGGGPGGIHDRIPAPPAPQGGPVNMFNPLGAEEAAMQHASALAAQQAGRPAPMGASGLPYRPPVRRFAGIAAALHPGTAAHPMTAA